MFTYLTDPIYTLNCGGGGVLETPNWVPSVHDKVPLIIGGAMPLLNLDETLTGKFAAQKLKHFCCSSLWTCLHHTVILRSKKPLFFDDFSLIESL